MHVRYLPYNTPPSAVSYSLPREIHLQFVHNTLFELLLPITSVADRPTINEPPLPATLFHISSRLRMPS